MVMSEKTDLVLYSSMQEHSILKLQNNILNE